MFKMMQILIAALAVIFTLAISGCASTGNTKLAAMGTNDVSKLLTKGKTTVNDVRAQFGEPSDVDFDPNGNKKWTYEHVKKSSKPINFVPYANLFYSGTNDTKKKLVMIFDKNDTLLDFLVTETAEESKQGVFG